MTFLILEGPNGAGKSTIAKALKPHTHYCAGPPTADTAYGEWVEPLVKYAGMDINRLMVADRWHIGEAVYPALLKPPRPRLATDLELGQISRTLHAMIPNTIIVYVMPPPQIMRERFEARGIHWQVELQQAEAAYGRYLEVISDRLHANCQYRILSSQDSVLEFIEAYRTNDEDATGEFVGGMF